MANKIYTGQSLRTRQTITLKRTIRLASLGTSTAVVLCFLLFITFNSHKENAVAGNKSVKSDTSKFAHKALFDASDSVVKYHSKAVASDSIYSLREEKMPSKKQRKSAKIRKREESEAGAFEDFISISPKNTSGSFNVAFQLPGKETFSPKIELLNLKGKVIDTKIATPENGQIQESFTLDKDLPDGPYLVKIYMNKELFVRQVVLQRGLM